MADRTLVHDLNADPALPLPDAAFDAAVCTVSVDYLVRPVAVLAEVARVLRPGGVLRVAVPDAGVCIAGKGALSPEPGTTSGLGACFLDEPGFLGVT